MTIFEATALTQSQIMAILAIWNSEYPGNINYQLADFEQYLHALADKRNYLLFTGDALTGWAFTFMREKERWFAIILDHSIQGQGFGTQLLDKLKEKEPILNGWVMDHDNAVKANGEKYKSPLAFYIKNKFVVSTTRLETEKLSAVKIIWYRDGI
jgi:GNAT superfamily N-acetyltransferase